jgi:hypothetical protein
MTEDVCQTDRKHWVVSALSFPSCQITFSALSPKLARDLFITIHSQRQLPKFHTLFEYEPISECLAIGLSDWRSGLISFLISNVSLPALGLNYPLKAFSLQAWSGPEGSRKLRFPDFLTTAQDVVRLSALRTGRIYHRKHTWYSFLLEAESTPGPFCDQKDLCRWKFHDTIWDKTSDLVICSAVP